MMFKEDKMMGTQGPNHYVQTMVTRTRQEPLSSAHQLYLYCIYRNKVARG